MMDFIEVNKYIDELRSAGYTWQEVCDACNIKYEKNMEKQNGVNHIWLGEQLLMMFYKTIITNY